MLGSVGRFVPQKGYLELLDGFAELAGAWHVPLCLVLAGGGPLESRLRSKAETLPRIAGGGAAPVGFPAGRARSAA